MTSSSRVRDLGQVLVVVSLILIALRIAVYIAGRLLVLAGYLGALLLIAGALLWFIGSVMKGYTEHTPRNQ